MGAPSSVFGQGKHGCGQTDGGRSHVEPVVVTESIEEIAATNWTKDHVDCRGHGDATHHRARTLGAEIVARQHGIEGITPP